MKPAFSKTAKEIEEGLENRGIMVQNLLSNGNENRHFTSLDNIRKPYKGKGAWQPDEIRKLEYALRCFGEDFGMIESLFTDRTRKEIKVSTFHSFLILVLSLQVKVNKEKKERPEKINDILDNKIDLATYELEYGKIGGDIDDEESNSSDGEIIRYESEEELEFK